MSGEIFNVVLQGIAGRLGCPLEVLNRTANARPFFLTPGKTVAGEKPLPLGSIVNLRRHPPTYDHPSERGWVVGGYRQNREGRWLGHTLYRGTVEVESALLSRCEAFDLVERFEVAGA
jgi:hypothetical protein